MHNINLMDVLERYNPDAEVRPIVTVLRELALHHGHGDVSAPLDEFVKKYNALPKEEWLAIEDYWAVKEGWCELPIVHFNGWAPTHPERDISRRIPYSPAVYKAVRGLTKPLYKRWLRYIASARSKIPVLGVLLGAPTKGGSAINGERIPRSIING